MLREETPYPGTTSSSEKDRTFALNAAAAPALMTLTPSARVVRRVQATYSLIWAALALSRIDRKR